MKADGKCFAFFSFSLLLLSVSGCISPRGGDHGEVAGEPWASSLEVGAQNVGDHPVNVSMRVAYAANNTTVLADRIMDLQAGEAANWTLDLDQTNYTVRIRVTAESRQEVNPDPPELSASTGMSFAASECPAGSRTQYDVDVQYEDADLAAAGPYVSESVRATGDLKSCA